MEGQEVVNQTPAEQTVVTDSTPVEETVAAGDSEQAVETSENTPVGEDTGSDKVSKAVPYDRFKEVNDEVRALKEQLAQMQQPVQPVASEPMAEFDPDVTNAVKRLAAQEAQEILAQQRVAEFKAKHAAELEKDPLLRAAVEAEMREQAATGNLIMPEKAYESATKILNERLNRQAEQAKKEGVVEGQDIAKTKQQLGAVGETGKVPEVSEQDLSPSDYAKLHNIPRVD